MKRRLKKITSMLLAVSMVVMLIPSMVLGAEAGDATGTNTDTVLFQDDFSSYTPGSSFTIGTGNKWTSKGTAAVGTVVQDSVTGATYGSFNNDSVNTSYLGFSGSAQSGGMVLEFDINIPSSKGVTLWTTSSSDISNVGKGNNPMRYVLNGGKFYNYGDSANQIAYDVTHWYRFNVVFNIPNHTYTISIKDLTADNQLVTNKQETFYNAVDTISSFMIAYDKNAQGATVNLTNVRWTALDLGLSSFQLAANGSSLVLNPSFDPKVTQYIVDVPYSTSSIAVTAAAGNTDNVTVSVGDNDDANGASVDVPISWGSGDTVSVPVTVSYTAFADMVKTYTVNVNRLEKSPNLQYVVTEAHDGQVKIGWEEPQDPSYTEAHIYQVGEDNSETLVSVVPQGKYIATVNGLTNDTEYTFVVKAAFSDDSESNGVTVTATPIKLDPRLMENLNRGLVAMKRSDGVYVGWRLLGTDPDNIAFNVYRDGVKVNASPITDSTNLLDSEGTSSSNYFVRTVLNGVESVQSETVDTWDSNYLSIPLNKPEDGVTPDNVAYTYRANDATVADLDGDGDYEVILKWDPSNSKDNSQSGYTGNTYVDAYEMDGTFLWRIDLGHNIRSGAHYLDVMAYDLDGDGKAEVTFRTADGTIDGQGNVIGDADADYRNSSGYVLDGPEYHTVFEGTTGRALDTENYEPARGNVGDWGDTYGNRVDRFLATIAYLDGVHPSVVMQRGYYTRMVMVAYDFIDGQLVKRWTFDSNDYPAYAGQGNHNLSVVDVDGDGKDEIITGAAAIDDDGTPLWNSGLGHGDALHVGDLDPTRLGLEEWAVQEVTSAPYSADLKDARTGRVLWGQAQVGKDIGRGLSADIDPTHIGEEMWAIDDAWNSTTGGLYTARGEKISTSIPSSNFAIWWDGDLSRELLDHNYDEALGLGVPTIDKWDYVNNRLVNLVTFDGMRSNNGTKGNPSLQADLFGDWREEVMVPTDDSTELRIFSTTDLTSYRFVTLMHDPVYRLGVAWQNTGYNQPPHTSFYLGNDMEQPDKPNIVPNALEAQSLTVYSAVNEVEVGGQVSFFPVMSSASSLSSVTWTVTNESDEPTELASIDQNGILTAIGAGTVKVKVVSGDLTGSQLITINPLGAKLSATAATYYTNAGADITVTVTLNGNTLTGIKNGDTALADTDYSVADATSDGKQVVTIKKSYLATLSNGDVLTFEFSAGEPAELTITVTTQQTNNPTPDPVTSTDPDSATDTDTDSGTDSGAVTQTPTPEKPVLNSAIANAEKIKSNVQQALQTNAAVHFPDVAATHWAAKAIEYASQLGIVEGAPNGEFKGSANVTRAEFAAMIVRALGIDTTEEGGSFSDTTGHWADAVIRALHRAGIVNGTGNGAFNPDQEITRAEMAAILARVLDMSAANGASKFSDINGHWAAENIEQLNRAGIVDGVGDGKFAPNNTATRDQSVAIIMRMLNIVLDLDLDL